MAKAGWSREKAEERWKVHRLNENIAQGVADAMAVVGALGTARAVLTRTYRWAVGLGEVGAIGKAGGPGKWVEVPRGPYGLVHQSKMSGKPIVERNGKYYIQEYEVNGVKFDGYKNGKLYEYKDNYSHLFDKNNELYSWVKDPDQWLRQARDQVDAANGIPVIWRVGSNQVEAFRKALGNIPGVTVKP
jgi:Restriction endonuclease fold toxin 5